MLKTEDKNWLSDFKVKLISLYVARVFCISFAIAFLFLPIANYFNVSPILSFTVVFLGALSIGLIIKPIFKINNSATAKYLDQHFPQLEESTALLLKPQADLSLLEQLQVNKINLYAFQLL